MFDDTEGDFTDQWLGNFPQGSFADDLVFIGAVGKWISMAIGLMESLL
jgi:hypothetical protein